ncbi:MAG: hypothetical protein K6L60_14700 [Oceanobacter sp.]
MSLFRCILTGFIITLLAGCGWTLSKPRTLPPALRVVHIDDSLATTFQQVLTNELSARGSLIVAAPADALTRIMAGKADIEQRDLTVDSFGKTREYALNANACITIQQGLSPQRQICSRARTRLSNDTSRVLATQLEREERHQELRASLAQQLINQLVASDTAL